MPDAWRSCNDTVGAQYIRLCSKASPPRASLLTGRCPEMRRRPERERDAVLVERLFKARPRLTEYGVTSARPPGSSRATL